MPGTLLNFRLSREEGPEEDLMGGRGEKGCAKPALSQRQWDAEETWLAWKRGGGTKRAWPDWQEGGHV